MNQRLKFLIRHPLIFTLLVVLFFMAILNYAARLYLEKPAPLAQQAVLEGIYGKDWVDDYRTVMSEQGLGQKYYPFVEYIEKPRHGKFVNVSDQGTRCLDANQISCIAKGGKDEIWIFGGSTAFGYSVKDNETIAAYLSKSIPGFRIINFGTASYYSTIERIRFESMLTMLPPPKAAIFIDGLNDFYFFNVPDESVYSNAYSLIFDKEKKSGSLISGLRKWLERFPIYRFIVEKFGKSIKIESAPASQEQLSKAITRLHINHSIVESVGSKFGIAILNVIQPIPLYGVGHQTSHVPKEALNFGDHINSGLAYQIMSAPEGEFDKLDSQTLNLASLGIDEAMYIDTVHYSPLFNEKIASEIYKKLSPMLKIQRREN